MQSAFENLVTDTSCTYWAPLGGVGGTHRRQAHTPTHTHARSTYTHTRTHRPASRMWSHARVYLCTEKDAALWLVICSSHMVWCKSGCLSASCASTQVRAGVAASSDLCMCVSVSIDQQIIRRKKLCLFVPRSFILVTVYRLQFWGGGLVKSISKI